MLEKFPDDEKDTGPLELVTPMTSPLARVELKLLSTDIFKFEPEMV